jgi:hypothetical protein
VLRQLPSFSTVIIDWAKLTKKVIQSLAELKNVTQIDLANVDIPENSIGILARMTQLKSLYVLSTGHISREEIDHLKAALPRCDVSIYSSK